MASQEITSDSGICLSRRNQSSNVPVRVSRSSSDSEHSTDEEAEHAICHSRRTSRIPITTSQNSGSDSSEDDHGRSKPTVIDSGIYLNQGQGKEDKELSVKELFAKTRKASSLATRTSALGKQAQLKQTVSHESKKNKKVETAFSDHCDFVVWNFNDDKVREKSGSELDESDSSDEKEAISVSLVKSDALSDEDNEDSASDKTPSLDASFVPYSAENYADEEKPKPPECLAGGESGNGTENNQEPDDKNREDTCSSIQLEDEPAPVKNEEEAEGNYSDDHIEEDEDEDEDEEDEEEVSSSEEERTPTFEFNMSLLSIGNSGCGDLNEPLDEVKVRNTDEDGTVSDVSEIENEQVSCEEPVVITRGSLQRQHSSWKLFNDIPGHTDLEEPKEKLFEDVEAVEDKHHDHTEVNERKHFDDEELERMDEEMFGLLRSAGHSSRVSVVFPGANDNASSQNNTFSRTRKVRIIVEPEVFLVPFSSNEFNEPFFEDTDVIPEKEIESPFKNIYIDPLSGESRNDTDVTVEEDIPEENSPQGADLEDEDNSSPGLNGFRRGDGSKSENELAVDKGNIADELNQNNNNISVNTNEDTRDRPSSGFQKQSRFKNLDPQSQEFVDDLDNLLDSAEEDIQEEFISKMANLASKVDPELATGTNAMCREDEEPNYASKAVTKTQLPSVLNEIPIEKEVIGEEFNHTSKSLPVNKKEAVDLPDYEVQKHLKVFVDDEDNSHNNIITSSVKVYSAEHENTFRIVEEFQLKQGKEQDTGSNSDASTQHQMVTTEQISIKVLSHNDNEECQRMGEETENVVHHEDELLFEAANSGIAVILPGSREKEDSFKCENVVPRSMANDHDNVNAVLEQINERGDEVVTGNIQTSNRALHFTERDGTEWHPVVFAQTTHDAVKTSNLSMPTKETVKCLGNDIRNMNESTQSEADRRDQSFETTMPKGLEESAINTECFPEKDKMEKKVECSDTLENLHAKIKALSKCNEDLKCELDDKDEEIYTMECIIKSVTIENEKLLDQVDDLGNELQIVRSEKEDIELQLNKSRGNDTETLRGAYTLEELYTEIKALKRCKEKLRLQLEESDKQRSNVDYIVEQVNIENGKLLERMNDLEKELGIALSHKKDIELEIEDLKKILQETKKESEAEATDIAYELEQLKKLHRRIGDICVELCGKKEKAYVNSLEKSNATKSRLRLLQESRAVMLSIVQMSDEFKDTMLEVLKDSSRHKGNIDTEMTQIKEESLQILDQQNLEIKTLIEQNEELNVQLEESVKQRCNMDNIVNSVNIENERLLERINGLENKLKTALNEKNFVEEELSKKNSDEEYRKRELLNMKDIKQSKTFNWGKMEMAFNHVWNEKNKLKKELGLITATYEQSEAAKKELVKEVERMKLELEKLQNKQANYSKVVDCANLREEEASSTSNDAEFADEKDSQYKIRIEEQIDEIERENSLIFQELAQASDKSKPLEQELKYETASRNSEKQINTKQDEVHPFINERIHTLRKGEGSKIHYKKLKKQLIRSEKGIKSLALSLQRDMEDNKETDKEFKRQIQKGMEQLRFLLKQATEKQVDKDKEKNTSLCSQRNELEHEMNRCNLRLEHEKAQELENMYREFSGRLQEKERDLEIYKRKLNERNERVEELNQQLQSEKEDNKRLGKSLEAAESNAKEQVKDKQHEVNQLRKFLTYSDENAENLKGQVKKISKKLEDAKNALSQRDTELSSAKTSLCEGDELLNLFKKSLVEIQQELEETKRELIEKNVALKYTERYPAMLFKSARPKDNKIGVTNELVNKVVRDIERAENVLQRKAQPKSLRRSNQEMSTETELYGIKQSNEEREMNSFQNRLETSLEEKDRTTAQLKSSTIQLKQDLELTSCSLKKKENELQQLIGDFEKQNKELEISNGRNTKLEDENSSLRNELMQLNTVLSQQNDEVKELRGLVITTDSELMTLNLETEKLKFLLQEKEQNIHFMKHELVEKERKSKSLTEHLQKKMEEIRRLQDELENMRIEGCKSLQDYPGLIAHMKASGKSAKDLQDLRKAFEHRVRDDKETRINYLENFVRRLEQDLSAKNILLEEKDEKLATANVGMQVKEEELDIVKTQLRQLREKFEACKQNSSERESRLEKEYNTLENKVKDLETILCHSGKKIEELKHLLETKVTECGRNDKPAGVNIKEVEVAKLAGKQITNEMTDRIQQMLANMNAMQMELKSSRNENKMIKKKNKVLKERVKRLQKEIVQTNQGHSERLNNVLENVRKKRKAIQSLKTLLRESQKTGSAEQLEDQEVPHSITARVNNEVDEPDRN